MDANGTPILLVEDDPDQRRGLTMLLARRGLAVVEAGSGEEATRVAMEQPVGVAIIDLHLPDMPGYALIQRLHEVQPAIQCVILTGVGTTQGPDEARLAGASDYFEKPILDHSRFFQVVRRAQEVFHLRRTVELLEPQSSRLIGRSPLMLELGRMVDRIAATSASVLITGESGVGKEVVAEALHEQSRRRGEFVRINCAALPESLIEAELFGVEEGTFTGQKGRREGLLAQADGGTLFLDEIGEMPLGLQPKLLRVLQSGAYQSVGGRRERELSARVVAATNVDLHDAIRGRRFREDLYFRLAVLELYVPPLRDRAEDIPLLAAHFVRKFAASDGREAVSLSPEALDKLVAHSWPGNVRELSNTLLRAVILEPGRVLGPGSLQFGSTSAGRVARPVPVPGETAFSDLLGLSLSEAKKEALARFSRAYLKNRLAEADGNVTRAATLAGMLRPNFKREMRRFGIEAEGQAAAAGSGNSSSGNPAAGLATR